MNFDIEWINTTPFSIDYSEQAVREWDQGMKNCIDVYTDKFEKQYNLNECTDIGGLIVYTAVNNTVVAVYDYENFVGWVV